MRGHGVGGVEVRNSDRHVDRFLAADLADLDDRHIAIGENLAGSVTLDESLEYEAGRSPAEQRPDRAVLFLCDEITLNEKQLVAALMDFVCHPLDLLGNAGVDQRRHHRPDDPAGAPHARGQLIRDEALALDRIENATAGRWRDFAWILQRAGYGDRGNP